MATETIHVDRIEVAVRRADKPLFPDGITKSELAGYYQLVADRMLPYLAGRPLAMERFPDGVDGQRVFQKNVPDYFPDWLRRMEVPKEDGKVRHALCDQPATLVYLAGQACITPHVFLSRADQLDHPDQMVFDLDPPGPEHFDAARRGALTLRRLLEDELGLVAFARTTGGKGLHVHVPLHRGTGFGQVRELARSIAGVLAGREPDRFTVEQRKAARGDRVFVDVLRNAYAQTVVAPYAVRARPGAPVSHPLEWDEVADRRLRTDRFDLRGAQQWLAEPDPWSGMSRRARRLDRPRQRLAELGRTTQQGSP
jgi:bifunctional non-homologous end joining protein LigD